MRPRWLVPAPSPASRSIVEQASGKLVLVGDPAQLPEIDAGGTFRALARQSEPVTLSDNRRQIHAWERAALADLRAGRVEQAVAAYDDRHRIHFAPTAEAAMGAMVGDWWAARQTGAHAIMLARPAGHHQRAQPARPRRPDRSGRTRRARATRRRTGVRGGRRGDRAAQRPAPRDRQRRCRHRHPPRPRQATITVALPARNRRPERTVVLPAGYTARHLDYAYALTAYKAQGVTVDATFSFGDDTLSTEAGYTTLSRGRISNELYWVAAEPAEAVHDRTDPHGELRRALATSRAQHSATSMLGEVGALAASCTLDQLEGEHMRLAISIRHDMPADVSVELAAARRDAADIQNRLNDSVTAKERLAGRLAATPLWRRTERAQLQRQLAETDRDTHSWAGRLPAAHQRVGQLETAQQQRQEWIDANTPRLVRHAQLAAAITRRQTNLVAIATIRAPAWLTDTIGPYPDSPGGQRVWRHQARDLLSTHDRQQAEPERSAAQATINPEGPQARSPARPTAWRQPPAWTRHRPVGQTSTRSTRHRRYCRRRAPMSVMTWPGTLSLDHGHHAGSSNPARSGASARMVGISRYRMPNPARRHGEGLPLFCAPQPGVCGQSPQEFSVTFWGSESSILSG